MSARSASLRYQHQVRADGPPSWAMEARTFGASRRHRWGVRPLRRRPPISTSRGRASEQKITDDPPERLRPSATRQAAPTEQPIAWILL